MDSSRKSKKGILVLLTKWFPFTVPYYIGSFSARFRMLIHCGSGGYINHIRFNKFLRESQWWPQEKLEEYQMKKLFSLLEHTINNVSYYTDLFKQRGLDLSDFSSLNDIAKIPLLTRESLADNADRLIAKNIDIADNKRYLLKRTSGSTGSPIAIYWDKKEMYKQEIYNYWLYSMATISKLNKHIKLWSRLFIDNKIKDVKYHDPYNARISLSTVPNTSDSMGEYLRIIDEFKPAYIIGPPSFLYNLAGYALENGFDDVNFPAFMSCYENIYAYQKKTITKQFRCNIFRCYGSEEFHTIAMECERGSGMHIDLRKGILEIIDEKGKVLPNGQKGRVVYTGLDNHAMPLIRYVLGDISTISTKRCSCERGLPLLESIDGRVSEIIKYNGKYIYPATLSVMLERFPNIKECQFVKDDNKITINIVKRPLYSPEDTTRLVMMLKDMIDKNLNLDINFVDSIPRTKVGKFKFIINNTKK